MAVVLVFIFAVLVLAWLIAGIAYVAILATGITSIISGFLDHPEGLGKERARSQRELRAADSDFLRDVGIRP